MEKQITLTVNGKYHELSVKPWRTILEVIREDLGLTGPKEGCGMGECGACTVIVDGKTVNACLMLAAEANGKEISTIEGLASDGKLHPIQEAFMEGGALQCGFCTPGMIISAKALLDENSQPSEDEIRRNIAGNLCRCTGYAHIVKAIKAASVKMKGGRRNG